MAERQCSQRSHFNTQHSGIYIDSRAYRESQSIAILLEYYSYCKIKSTQRKLEMTLSDCTVLVSFSFNSMVSSRQAMGNHPFTFT